MTPTKSRPRVRVFPCRWRTIESGRGENASGGQSQTRCKRLCPESTCVSKQAKMAIDLQLAKQVALETLTVDKEEVSRDGDHSSTDKT